MKIVQIISNLGNGGAEKFTIELSNELSKQHEVTLISFRNVEEGMLFPKLLHKKVQLIELGKKDGFSIRLMYKIFTILNKIKPDVVHLHLDTTLKYVFPLTFWFHKVTFIYTIHSNINESNRAIFTSLNRTFFNIKKLHFVCISESICKEFSKTFTNIEFKMVRNGLQKIKGKKNNIPKEVQSIIGIDNKYYKKLISVGRISKEKNHLLLLNSMRKFPTIQCLIIGDLEITDEDYLQELLTNKPDNVQFIGKQSAVVDIFSQCDAFIMSSDFEGLPISALEAMSVGLPILTTPCGGMVDLIKNQVNGFISPDFSEENFVLLIKSFLNSTEDNIQHIKRNNIEKFTMFYTIESCAKNYLKVIR